MGTRVCVYAAMHTCACAHVSTTERADGSWVSKCATVGWSVLSGFDVDHDSRLLVLTQRHVPCMTSTVHLIACRNQSHATQGTAGLRLSPCTLTKIFAGDITTVGCCRVLKVV